jgi:fatty acid desaturase
VYDRPGEVKMDNNNGAMKFCDVLLIVFVVLKLVGVINWSWWWVLAPFWIPFLLYILLIVAIKIAERKGL